MQTPRVLVSSLLCLLAASGPALAAEPAAASPERSANAEDLVDANAAAATAAPSAPHWAADGAAERGGYRWSLTRGALDLGIRFEPRIAAALPIDARYDSAAPAGVALPSISFGLRSVAAGPAPAGSLIERALGSETSVPAVSKIGIEWKPAESQVFFRRGIGFRLGGDDRLVMRLRASSIGIYMHRTF
jgi:hypothetical protein